MAACKGRAARARWVAAREARQAREARASPRGTHARAPPGKWSRTEAAARACAAPIQPARTPHRASRPPRPLPPAPPARTARHASTQNKQKHYTKISHDNISHYNNRKLVSVYYNVRMRGDSPATWRASSWAAGTRRHRMALPLARRRRRAAPQGSGLLALLTHAPKPLPQACV